MKNVGIQTIKQSIESTVKNGRFLSLKTCRITEVVENLLHHAVSNILAKHEHSGFDDVLYPIIKELLINGCKANHKRIFFNELNLDIRKPDDYTLGVEKYRNIFSEKMACDYGAKAKKYNYYVLLNFDFDENGLTVEVINNSPIVRQEEIQLREKLKEAMKYNDIAEFYMKQGCAGVDEGAGLGLALILILLKGENIDPGLFRIFLKEDKTIARLEIPYTKNFRGCRDARTD